MTRNPPTHLDKFAFSTFPCTRQFSHVLHILLYCELKSILSFLQNNQDFDCDQDPENFAFYERIKTTASQLFFFRTEGLLFTAVFMDLCCDVIGPITTSIVNSRTSDG